jgi:hypothetical protein
MKINKALYALNEVFNAANDYLQQHQFDYSRFPDFACHLLEALNPSEIPFLISLFNGGEQENIMRIFGNEHLALNIHYWPQGITNCHNHQFCGAFRILKRVNMSPNSCPEEI